MNEMTHTSKADFDAFKRDLMQQKEKEAFLEHICSCDYCSEQFAISMSEVLIEAPRNMKENILMATMRPEVQLAIKIKESSKRMKLFLYSLKVGAATIVALLVLLLTMNTSNFHESTAFSKSPSNATITKEDKIPLTAVVRDNMDAFSNRLLVLSNNIMNMEVTNND